jgi:hypothetical protein
MAATPLTPPQPRATRTPTSASEHSEANSLLWWLAWQVAAEAQAKAEAVRITTVATAQAERIRKVTEAIRDCGEQYLRYRQIEMLPEIARPSRKL